MRPPDLEQLREAARGRPAEPMGGGQGPRSAGISAGGPSSPATPSSYRRGQLWDAVRTLTVGWPALLFTLALVVAVVVLVVVVRQAAPRAAPIGDLVPYVNQSPEFSISYPSDWTVTSTDLANGKDGTLHRVRFSSSDPNAYFMVDTFVAAAGRDPAAEFASLRGALKRQYGADYRQVSFSQNQLAGLRAYRWQFVIPVNGIRSRRIDVGAFDGQREYALLAAAPARSFGSYKHMFSQIFASFQLAASGALSQQQWDALFKAGKVMVGCNHPTLDHWNPMTQATYVFHRCTEPVWSSTDVDQSNVTAGVRPVRSLQTPQGTLSLLAYYNSMAQGTNGATFLFFYLQGKDGFRGLVGAVDGWGPIDVRSVGGDVELTIRSPVYLGQDPNCCASVVRSATFKLANQGLRLVARHYQFESNGVEAQQLIAEEERLGYSQSQATDVMNSVASLVLDPDVDNLEKKARMDALSKRWSGEAVSLVASALRGSP